MGFRIPTLPRPLRLRSVQWVCAVAWMVLGIVSFQSGCSRENSALPTLPLRETSVPAEEWRPLWKDGQAGYQTPTGDIILPPMLRAAFPFRDGRAIVQYGDGPRYLEDDTYYIIDDRGRWITTTPRDYMMQFVEGMAAFGDRDDPESEMRYGYLNRDGEVIYPARLPSVPGAFREGYGLGWDGQQWLFISKTGEVAAKYAEANRFSEGLAAVKANRNDDEWTIVDTAFQAQFVLRADDVLFFSEGLLPFERDGRVGYVNRQGEIAIEPSYQVGFTFTGGLAPVKTEAGWVIINRQGEPLTSPAGKQQILTNMDIGQINSLGYIADGAERLTRIVEGEKVKGGHNVGDH